MYELDAETIQDFAVETEENLQIFESSLLELEKEVDDKETVNEAFRSIHTIKGLANYLGLEEIADLTHLMETLLADVRAGKSRLDPSLLELQLSAKDALASLVQAIVDKGEPGVDISELKERLADKSRAEQEKTGVLPDAGVSQGVSSPAKSRQGEGRAISSGKGAPLQGDAQAGFFEELDLSDDIDIGRLSIPGIGKSTIRKLKEAGFVNVGDLRKAAKESLTAAGINAMTAELILAEVKPFACPEPEEPEGDDSATGRFIGLPLDVPFDAEGQKEEGLYLRHNEKDRTWEGCEKMNVEENLKNITEDIYDIAGRVCKERF